MLVAAANPFGLITRGPMVLRDVDLLLEGARRADVTVNVSIPTLDERVWRTTEPGTARPERRMAVVAQLAAAGLDVSVAMAPILPGLSDAPEQLEAVVRAARAAGARADLGEPRLPQARDARALPRGARPRLAGAASPLRAAVRRARVSSEQ